MGDRILLVDDENIIVRVLTAYLTKNGYDVLPFTEPVKALESLEQEKGTIALIVSDLNMPVMDGLQFCQASRRFCPETPFVILTGQADQHTTEAVSNLDIDAFISKPIQHAAFIAAVERVIKRATHQKEATCKFIDDYVTQMAMILEGKVPSGFSSFDFTLKRLEKNKLDQGLLYALKRITPTLNEEKEFLEAKDVVHKLQGRYEERAQNIRTVLSMLKDHSAKKL